jgi:hypothetical protein
VREVQEPLPRRHVGDARRPGLAGRLGAKVALEEVGSDAHSRQPHRRAPALARHKARDRRGEAIPFVAERSPGAGDRHDRGVAHALVRIEHGSDRPDGGSDSPAPRGSDARLSPSAPMFCSVEKEQRGVTAAPRPNWGLRPAARWVCPCSQQQEPRGRRRYPDGGVARLPVGLAEEHARKGVADRPVLIDDLDSGLLQAVREAPTTVSCGGQGRVGSPHRDRGTIAD